MLAAMLATVVATSWCADERTGSALNWDWHVDMSFTLENGKTVSICHDADSNDLTYFYGVLGEAPELEYSGPVRGMIEVYSWFTLGLADLNRLEPAERAAAWDLSPKALADATHARDTKGFFIIKSYGCCGGAEMSVLFRSRGWEYAVRSGYRRNVIPDIATKIGDYLEWKLITLISPDGTDYIIR